MLKFSIDPTPFTITTPKFKFETAVYKKFHLFMIEAEVFYVPVWRTMFDIPKPKKHKE